MQNQFNLSVKTQNNQYPTKNFFKGLFGLKYLKGFTVSSESVEKNVDDDREKLFMDIFGVPYTENETELNNIIKNKINNLDEYERLTINDKLSFKVKEIESGMESKKSKTLKRLIISISMLTVGFLSCWYLFENDVIVTMKLMLCQSSIIGFIAGFKELHVVVFGEKDTS